MERDRPLNVLMTQLYGIGDVLLCTGAAAAIKQGFPKARITMLVQPFSADIVRNNPVVDEVIAFRYGKRKASFMSMLKIFHEIRRARYDVLVALDRKPRPALLGLLAGIPVRIGPAAVFGRRRSWVTRLFTVETPVLPDVVQRHQFEVYQSIVRPLVTAGADIRPVLPRLEPHREKAAELMTRLPEKKLRVALCLRGASSSNGKNWPLENFRLLIERLASEFDAAFFTIGSRGDRSYCDSLRPEAVTVQNFCGETSLPELAALLKETDLFITVDTGPMHIAAALNTVPVVAIFGFTSPVNWGPMSSRAISLHANTACSPCHSKKAEACASLECLREVSVEQVAAAASKLLSKD